MVKITHPPCLSREASAYETKAKITPVGSGLSANTNTESILEAGRVKINTHTFETKLKGSSNVLEQLLTHEQFAPRQEEEKEQLVADEQVIPPKEEEEEQVVVSTVDSKSDEVTPSPVPPAVPSVPNSVVSSSGPSLGASRSVSFSMTPSVHEFETRAPEDSKKFEQGEQPSVVEEDVRDEAESEKSSPEDAGAKEEEKSVPVDESPDAVPVATEATLEERTAVEVELPKNMSKTEDIADDNKSTISNVSRKSLHSLKSFVSRASGRSKKSKSSKSVKSSKSNKSDRSTKTSKSGKSKKSRSSQKLFKSKQSTGGSVVSKTDDSIKSSKSAKSVKLSQSNEASMVKAVSEPVQKSVEVVTKPPTESDVVSTTKSATAVSEAGATSVVHETKQEEEVEVKEGIQEKADDASLISSPVATAPVATSSVAASEPKVAPAEVEDATAAAPVEEEAPEVADKETVVSAPVVDVARDSASESMFGVVEKDSVRDLDEPKPLFSRYVPAKEPVVDAATVVTAPANLKGDASPAASVRKATPTTMMMEKSKVRTDTPTPVETPTQDGFSGQNLIRSPGGPVPRQDTMIFCGACLDNLTFGLASSLGYGPASYASRK